MTQTAKDELYMRRCLELARKGLGLTRQNPLVGSVVVYNDLIIGEGYHHEYGGPHAEVNAINSVKDQSLLNKSSLYVNLEPCSHFGKTPPCSLLIQEKGIPRVVIGCSDSNPEVSGKGIKNLKSIGTEVISGVLEKESRYLNRRFFTFHEQKRPYIILKWAQTPDGFIDKERKAGENPEPSWITNHTSRMLVHKWRAEEISIMAGTNTIILDNPELNVREWPGENPLRIAPDKNGRLFEGLKILDGASPTLIFSGSKTNSRKNLEYVQLPPGHFEIAGFLKEIYKMKILSVFVEGGARLTQSFINSGLWDEAFVFVGNNKFIEGVKAPLIISECEEKFEFRGSMLNIYRNNAKDRGL
jgi:diaminohydroxyphosphoribosylaminopyrimidine deaminase/5-amino-6-(5-phosphoribosylamino)uracil reductase